MDTSPTQQTTIKKIQNPIIVFVLCLHCTAFSHVCQAEIFLRRFSAMFSAPSICRQFYLGKVNCPQVVVVNLRAHSRNRLPNLPEKKRPRHTQSRSFLNDEDIVGGTIEKVTQFGQHRKRRLYTSRHVLRHGRFCHAYCSGDLRFRFARRFYFPFQIFAYLFI